MDGCATHEWGHYEHGSPLACFHCGVLWPGEVLPAPAHALPAQHEPDKPSWASRVDAMLHDPIWDGVAA